RLERELRVQTAAAADERLAGVELVVWAVKPQVLQQALEDARAHLGPALHVSIAAGLPVLTLARWLGSPRVVRAMPNTAALVGAGVTGLVAARGVSEADRRTAESTLAAAGHCFWVADDERLDAVTAVTGSGPAYVFHFLEAFQAAAERVGFDAATARDLVLRTALGALEQSRLGEPFGLLRERVTSKRGTTEAALAVLDAQRTPEALGAAVQAARTRAGELARELSGKP
ncbi:MAG TPA: pyrroline-5-carboxylate reductase, partial [Pseudorhodoferax sp.]|nr:pyrroline-5-carboxylate reductase [Pseudorhodoferax sp.]